MKKFLLSIISMIILATTIASFPFLKASALTNQPVEIQGKSAALEASLQIRLYSEDGSYYDQGLGTLVEWQDERLVVTHNHWHFIHNLSKAELRSAAGSLLLALDSITFQSLIRYSDPGTLILQAPDELMMKPVSVSAPQNIQAGDTLIVAHQSLDDSNHVDLLRVRVDEVGTYKGKTALYYSNPDRNVYIVQGDSGGGVWLDGQFIGNNWGMYVSQAGPFWNRGNVQTTIAAQLPLGFFQTMQASQVQNQAESGAGQLSHWDQQELESQANDG